MNENPENGCPAGNTRLIGFNLASPVRLIEG